MITKNIILLAGLGVLATSSISANTDSDGQSFSAPLVKQSLLLDSASDKHTIVVGERGHILRAAAPVDAISDLTQVDVPTTATLTAVYTRGDLAWAVGHDATILKSVDGGTTWRVVNYQPELDRPFLDVLFFDDNEGVAIGAYGLFYRSTDGGETWQQENHPSVLSADDNEYLESIKDDEAFYLEELTYISPHFNNLDYANEQLFLAGEAGLVAVSNDKGKSWQRLDIDYEGSFFRVLALPKQRLLALGLRGNMYYLHDNQWRKIPSCITTSINNASVVDDQVVVFGNNGVLLTIDVDKLASDELQQADKEGCRKSAAVSRLNTEFADAILDGITTKDNLLLVTAGGLQKVEK